MIIIELKVFFAVNVHCGFNETSLKCQKVLLINYKAISRRQQNRQIKFGLTEQKFVKSKPLLKSSLFGLSRCIPTCLGFDFPKAR